MKVKLSPESLLSNIPRNYLKYMHSLLAMRAILLLSVCLEVIKPHEFALAVTQPPSPIFIPMAEKRSSLPLTQELAQLDEKLVTTLVARTNLLARAAASRRSKNLGITDPAQEKQLWQVWRDSSAGENLEPQLLKKSFTCPTTSPTRGLNAIHPAKSRCASFPEENQST